MRRFAQLGLRLLAAFYLVAMWFDGIGCELPPSFPSTIRYFVGVAALFPDVSTSSDDFRAEGWRCDEQAWQELDPRPYFPLHPDDKENRFQRTLHFFAKDPVVLRALDGYLVASHATSAKEDSAQDDGIPRGVPIGGVRLVLVREPIPKLGSTLTRYSRRPLLTLRDDVKHYGYQTSPGEREARCRETLASSAP